jgi:hypothetical protein
MESETCPVPRTELDYCRWRLNIAHQLTYQISLDHYKRSRKFFCRSRESFRPLLPRWGGFTNITEA